MALFGKLFEKKVCDLCGGEIGLLGNKKLEDGNCCKECAGKLSPWFDERRHSTVEQIRRRMQAAPEPDPVPASEEIFRIIQTYGFSTPKSVEILVIYWIFSRILCLKIYSG